VRSLRGRKSEVAASVPIRVSHEEERLPNGTVAAASTVFLAGKECPFHCVYCDLWRETLDRRTPPGAIPRQLEIALGEIEHRSLLKLYNASNFFDPAAVPTEDDAALLALLGDFEGVTVECHPHFVTERCFRFAQRLEGRLQVAIGLETVHPEVLPKLNKQMTVADFDLCAAELRRRGIGLRAFVLLGVPYLEMSRQLDWCMRSVEHAAAVGAEVISIIPVRGGNGAMEDLQERGLWSPISLDLLEQALDTALERVDAVVQVDLWDLERFAGCRRCLGARRERLLGIHRTGVTVAAVECAACR